MKGTPRRAARAQRARITKRRRTVAIPRRRLDPATRWQQIIAAATAEFYEKGYIGASMRDVGRRAGLLKGSLYHYIKSKQDLLFNVLRDLHDGARPLVERCRASCAPPLERLRAFIEELAPYSAEHAAQGMIFMRDFARLPAYRRRQIIAQRDLYSKLMRELIVEAQSRGEVSRDIDAALAAATLMGAIAWVANWYKPSGRLPAREIGRQQAALLIAALRHGTAAESGSAAIADGVPFTAKYRASRPDRARSRSRTRASNSRCPR
jgi:AcrR family transcriptional regulator